MLRFGEALDLVVNDFRPNQLTSYLFDLANCYSTFFEHCPVLRAETPELRTSRLAALRPHRADDPPRAIALGNRGGG